MPTATRIARIKEVLGRRHQGLILVLEDIHDPHNAAAVLRSAEAFGVGEVWVVYEKEEYANLRRVGKSSSSSANKWLTIRNFRTIASCYAALRRRGFTIIGTTLHEKRAKSLYSASLKGKKIAIVMGNEHRGMTRYAIDRADKLLMIPMRGFVESLNLSVSASIFLFEYNRQRAPK